MVGSEYDLKMYARDLGYTLPLIIGAQNHPFDDFATANSTAYVFATKDDIDNGANGLETIRVSYIVSKCYKLWSTNGLKLVRRFYLRFCILVHCKPSQSRRRRSVNGIQPNIANSKLIICCRKFGVVPPKKLGAKTFTLAGIFGDFET